jgi:hypothetical protein
MSRGRDQYVTDLTATVNELFADGINDPSAAVIAKRYWGQDKAVTKGMIEECRAKLGRVRRALDEDAHLTCPLSETYYRRFRGPGKLKTRDEARRCLPTRGLPQFGLLRLTGSEESDLIWSEWVGIQCNQAAGKTRLSVDDLLAAVQSGKMPTEQAREIVIQSQKLALPPAAQHGLFEITSGPTESAP